MKMGESRAIKKIAKRLPPFLASSYGYSDNYTSGQVGTAIESTGCNPNYTDHAFAMFCTKDTFKEVSNSDYDSLHQEVADICFDGNNEFTFSDASSYSSGGDSAGGD